MRRSLLLGVSGALVLTGCAGVQKAQQDAVAADALWTCRCAAAGIAAGRSAADGPEELWVAAGREVHRVGLEGAEVAWQAPPFSEIVRLEAIDLDSDGVHEWVVVLDAGGVRGEVVGVVDGRRVRVGKPWGGWLRAWWTPEGEPMLLGQRVGGDRPYWGDVSRLERDPEGRLQPVEGAPEWPPRVGIFDPFTIPGAADRMFGMREDGRVVEYGAVVGLASPETWVSEGRSVARPIELDRTFRSVLGEEEDAVVRLPPAPARIEGGVLLATGTPPTVAVFEDFIIHRGGSVRALRATEPLGAEWGATSPVMGRAFTGAAPWRPGGASVWAAAVWTRAPQEFGPAETRVLLFDPASGALVSPAALASPPPRPAWPAPRGAPPRDRPDRPTELP